MPISSSEVAANIGAFQQHHLMFAQQGNMLSDSIQRSMDAQSGANWFAGKATNAAFGAGVPLAGLGLGMMGLDPLSGGLRAGMAVGGRFGMGAGLAAGGLAAGALGGLGAVGSYAMQQMHMGMQQQQQFNATMQSRYNFLTPQGQGFSNQQLGVMSQQVRGIAGQMGPNGEMLSFGQVSNMAANMGSMGMATGMRDVQDFSRRLKEMVATATEMAKQLGTSIEGAQQAMQAMKTNGVFRASDQIRLSSEMRMGSLGGNLSMASMSNAASFGSQISRAVGGRARAGAFAGVRTLSQVGMAVESGVLSEEDIYNATGLTGEEGKQAFAASQLQQSASWLRGGKGRRFLASITGANGQLDARSVDAWMSGDMSTGATMNQAYKNLAGVGRADFIRNEGKLRGEALASFGGNIPAMALMQWAGSRGIDVNTMNDREMLFAQRHTGMGMEELENAVKMLRNMPDIQNQGRVTQAMDARRMDVAGMKAGSGLQGAKRNLEHMREHVQAKLQSAGSQMYSDLTEYIEDTLNRMSGTIMQSASADIDKVYQGLLNGDKGAAQRLGLGNNDVVKKLAGDSLVGGSGLTEKAFDKKLPFGTSMRDRVNAAGFGGYFGKDTDFAAATRQLDEAQRGMSNLGNKEAMALGGNLKGMLSEAYAGGIGDKKGAERLAAVRAMLEGSNNKDARQLAAYMSSSSTEQAFAALASAEAGMGLSENARVGAVSKLPGGLDALSSDGLTQNERTRRYGEIASGVAPGSRDANKRLAGNTLMGVGGMGGLSAAIAMGPLGIPFGLGMAGIGAATGYFAGRGGSNVMEKLLGGAGLITSSAKTTEFGNYLTSREGLKMSGAILGGGDMASSLQDQINAITGNGDADKMQRERLRSVLAGNNAMQAAKKAGVDVTKLDADTLKKIEEKAGARAGSAIDYLRAGAGSLLDQQKIDRREAGLMFGKAALGDVQRGQATGYLDSSGNLSASASASLLKGAGEQGARLAAKMANMKSLEAEQARAGTSDERLREIQGQLAGAGASVKDDMYGMSVADLRKLAKAERELGNFGGADELGALAGSRARGEATLSRRGNIGAAGLLGIKVGQGDANFIQNAKAGSGRLAAYLGNKLGIGTEEGIKSGLDNLAVSGMSSEQVEKRRKELMGQKGLAEKLKMLDSETDVSKRNRLIDEIKSDPMYKEQQAKKEKETEMNNPQLRYLSGIDETLKAIKTGIATLNKDKVGGESAPQPGP